MNDGTVWTGYPGNGPSQYMGFSNVTKVAHGSSTLCALDTNGAVACAGYNYYGQINGSPYNPYYASPPIPANDTNNQPISGALAISAGNEFNCVLRGDGTVICFGRNYEGEMGDGNTNCCGGGIFAVSNVSGASALASGYYHSCALSNGAVSCWGYNNYAQSKGNTSNPTFVTSGFAIPYL